MRKRIQDFLEIYQDPQYTDDYIKEMLCGWADTDFKGFPYSPDTFHATYELSYLDDNQICKVFFPDKSTAITDVGGILDNYNNFSYVIVLTPYK